MVIPKRPFIDVSTIINTEVETSMWCTIPFSDFYSDSYTDTESPTNVYSLEKVSRFAKKRVYRLPKQEVPVYLENIGKNINNYYYQQKEITISRLRIELKKMRKLFFLFIFYSVRMKYKEKLLELKQEEYKLLSMNEEYKDICNNLDTYLSDNPKV